MHMAVLSLFISLPISVPPEHPAASTSGFSANSSSVILILRDRFLHCACCLSLSLSQTFMLSSPSVISLSFLFFLSPRRL
ncbi:hypothetical protein B0H13DRAFT_2012933 [Mycena leptocephala]|nr:hypothetical protein B0H13DRAFT_2012933 [Mycena leptocephala]